METAMRVDVTRVDPPTWAQFRAQAALRGIPQGVLLTEVLRAWLQGQTPVVAQATR